MSALHAFVSAYESVFGPVLSAAAAAAASPSENRGKNRVTIERLTAERVRLRAQMHADERALREELLPGLVDEQATSAALSSERDEMREALAELAHCALSS